MSLKIHVFKQLIKAGIKAGMELFFGRIRLRDQIKTETLCERVSQNTSATPADVEGVLNALVTVIVDNLKVGNIVDLGDLGSLRMAAGSSGVEEEKHFKAHMIRRPKVVYTPGKDLKFKLNDARYEWLDKQVEIVVLDCKEAHFS